ncbi:MFS transporter [Actinokineospora soli]|uniref:MFS transporter n=1 Tax=Actinokineospora soli TaxID=1048753 RepID=A0ABW2TTD3_9PSEU
MANAVVSAVVMTTLVVGPFHLGALGLAPGLVGLVMSVGPVVSALTGVPAGRATDRHGARGVALVGLAGVVAGTALLAVAPTSVVGYAVPLAVVTASYALFQAANNTAVMADVPRTAAGRSRACSPCPATWA